jgi:hypothetical protein
MTHRHRISSIAVFLLLFSGCAQRNLRSTLRQNVPSVQDQPRVLAVYEPWFGHPQHISVGYSSQDPAVIRKQIDEAKSLGISGFVIDWYGDRQPFLDRSYALIQSIAGEKGFHVAMMYDETEQDTGQATDDAVAAFAKFHETYLAPNASGRDAYLTYNGQPVIFVFPKSGHTDWRQVREQVNHWDPRPLIIYEDRKTSYADAFDGFYAWINPGKKGWAPDGSNWGEDYLRGFYHRMETDYPNKIAVGGAWAGFDDRQASWSLGRYISQRCGETLVDTLRLSREYYSDEPKMPFLLIETWNDYEEGSAIERGLAKCKSEARLSAGE